MSDTANETASTEPQGTPEGGNGDQETPEAPTIEDLQKKIEELTGHSRKWETRAKENYEAKKELDSLRESQMTEEQKREKAQADAEARFAELETRAVTAEAALARYKVAAEFGLSSEDAEALASISDEATLRALAERLAGRSTAGPKPNPAQGNRSASAGPATTGEKFAEAVGHLFN